MLYVRSTAIVEENAHALRGIWELMHKTPKVNPIFFEFPGLQQL